MIFISKECLLTIPNHLRLFLTLLFLSLAEPPIDDFHITNLQPMRHVKEFFQCCGNSTNEHEIVINMQQKKRSFSCSSPEKRTFIKRSLGKKSILQLSPKDTNLSTVHTLMGKQSMKIKRITSKQRVTSSNSSHDFSMDQYERSRASRDTIMKDPLRNGREVHKFVNFHDVKERENLDVFFSNSNEKIFELCDVQQMRIAVPRLLQDRRTNKYAENIKMKCEKPSPSKASQLMTTMKTILETIEERSSIPSMEESQMHEMKQIASKATLKSNIYDKTGSPFTEKYASVMIIQNPCMRSFRMANSENLSYQNLQNNEELMNIVIHKLEMDNSILQRELNALLEQENFLKLQKKYDEQQFYQQISKLQNRKTEYEEKLAKQK